MLTCWSLGFNPVLQARSVDRRNPHLNEVFIYMNSNEPLNLVVLTALASAGLTLGGSTSNMY